MQCPVQDHICAAALDSDDTALGLQTTTSEDSDQRLGSFKVLTKLSIRHFFLIFTDYH